MLSPRTVAKVAVVDLSPAAADTASTLPGGGHCAHVADLTMAINLRAPFLMARAAFPALREAGAGRIVNLASQAAFVALDRHLSCCASKAGLAGLTKVLALEWAPYGITVNAISPTVARRNRGARPGLGRSARR